MNAVIACGGTGGHLFPGIAVAEALQNRGHHVMLLVSEKDIDAVALSGQRNFQVEKLPTVGLPSPFSPALFGFSRRFVESLALCRSIYRKFNPHVVLGMGGFTSTAPVLAGRFRGIATFIHESNAVPGKANRWIARAVNAVMLGFKECAPFFPKTRTEITGTPVRTELVRLDRADSRRKLGLREDLPTVLVMGGSQGASGINQALIKALPFLQGVPLQVIHLSGTRDERLVADNYRRENVPAYIGAFHHQMEEVYSAADLVVARAGAASLAEFASFSLPAILIPFPYAADDHQTRNAEIYAHADAAILLKQSDLSGELLARNVRELMENRQRLQQMAANCARLAPSDAAGRVANTIEKYTTHEAHVRSNPTRADSSRTAFRRRKELPELSRFLTTEQHRIHLVGVAGSGMSGLAGLLIELGHVVSGSDKVITTETERLQRLGLRFHEQHLAEHADAADLVVFSSAIKDDNPILLNARSCGKPLFRRAEAVAAIMQAKRGIVIAGMHGKTTTSAMTAHVLREGGLHPSHYVGAEIPILGTNAFWNPRGEYFVAEGDESDGTLRCFHPEHALILNIEEEHLDFYPDLGAIENVFSQFIAQTSGSILYNIDDPNTARLCANRKGAISYGFSEQADYCGVDVELRNFASSFLVSRGGEKLGQATLNVPGEHNVHNALGVIALACELSIPFDKITASLRKFEHARRRFEIKYASDRFLLVDDYGHHPTEIRATLRTAKSIGRRRLVTMFQPHRFSRTKALCREFGSAFDDADRVVITDVYPASERPIPGITGQSVVDELVQHGHRGVAYEPDLQSVHRNIGNMLEAGDLVLSLGAGNIHEQLEILAGDLVIAEKLKAIVGEEGEVRLYEPLSNHTTLRVGGPAQFWVEPRTEQAFAELIRFCRDEHLPLFVIGRGSNLLVRDGGIRGVVAHPHGGDFEKIEIDGCEITAGAGAKLRQVAYAARAANLGGLEWMEGIPGTVGGGLRMNAGAMGSQTFEDVTRIRYLDAEGNSHVKNRNELEVFYRRFPLLEKNFAVSATFCGHPAKGAEIDARLRESQEKRRTTQPVAKSAGCIFKNPPTIPAGKLVDELGLKNSRVRNARVSRVHGNFIVNDGDATAAEVLELIDDIKNVARKKRGIELETEVEIVGEAE